MKMQNIFITKRISIMIIMISIFCSSCFTYKSITKKDEEITNEILSKIVPGKTYSIRYCDRSKVKLKIKKIDSVNVYAQKYTTVEKHGQAIVEIIPYQASKDELVKGATKISKRKLNLPITLAVPVASMLAISAYGMSTINLYPNGF